MGTKYIDDLKNEYQHSDCVWFFVDTKYRIVAYNKKAAQNSISLHNKEIGSGQSILDYARDTKNNIDTKFIECFGKAASGHLVKDEQHIIFDSVNMIARSNYIPVMRDKEVMGVSITVDYQKVNITTPQQLG